MSNTPGDTRTATLAAARAAWQTVDAAVIAADITLADLLNTPGTARSDLRGAALATVTSRAHRANPATRHLAFECTATSPAVVNAQMMDARGGPLEMAATIWGDPIDPVGAFLHGFYDDNDNDDAARFFLTDLGALALYVSLLEDPPAPDDDTWASCLLHLASESLYPLFGEPPQETTETTRSDAALAALSRAYPGVLFKVRIGFGGWADLIGWTDGPTEDQVNAVVRQQRVHAGADRYPVFTDRSYTGTFLYAALLRQLGGTTVNLVRVATWAGPSGTAADELTTTHLDQGRLASAMLTSRGKSHYAVASRPPRGLSVLAVPADGAALWCRAVTEIADLRPTLAAALAPAADLTTVGLRC